MYKSERLPLPPEAYSRELQTVRLYCLPRQDLYQFDVYDELHV